MPKSKKKPAEKIRKHRYCDYEMREEECPRYEKSDYCSLCKWGLFEGTCICYNYID